MHKKLFYLYFLTHLVVSICFISGSVRAQSSESNTWMYEGYIQSGMVIKNYLTPTFPKRKLGFQTKIEILHNTNGAQYWHKRLNYPTVGWVLNTGTLGNMEELGYTIGISPIMKFKWYEKEKNAHYITLGLGLSYYSRPFNKDSNPYNIMIGSHITALGYASYTYAHALSGNKSLLLGISVIHGSNSHIQVPNAGLNMPMVDIGIRFGSSKLVQPDTITGNTIWNKRIKLNMRMGIGVHERAGTISPTGTPKFAVYQGSIYASKRFGLLSNVHLGFTTKYYNAYAYQIEKIQNFPLNQKFEKSLVISLIAGYEFMLNRFSLLLQGGLDVYKPYFRDYIVIEDEKKGISKFVESWFSSRIGFNYYFKNPMQYHKINAFIGTYVNADFGEADFAEISLGLVF